jgi:hypothetical protein
MYPVGRFDRQIFNGFRIKRILRKLSAIIFCCGRIHRGGNVVAELATLDHWWR